MSIYNKGFDFNFSLGRAKTIIIAGLVVLFAVFALYTLYNLFTQSPLEVRFEQNPWKQGELQSNLLFVKVANITGKNVKLAVLEVRPRAFNSIIILPHNARISETLAPNDSRILAFDIRKAFPQQALPPGKYTIDLTVSFDGKEYVSETVLEVE
ncbi:MAG: hypothetical protein Q7R70_04185 [Candidatus Diapherotrites archaeon]|nr:hypothetical protein [Candidatus Diapherotrites archaeon]